MNLSTRQLINLLTRQLIYSNFCLLFSKFFNIMTNLFFTNSPLGRKKSILAKVGFDAKGGQHVNAVK